ncbi:unnamed protein product [Arabis nemorensis]|uniref:C2H2-type domain-containing protein n=1 Tax=Arabis nemorensis TaxID=586526 RepID=A0A565CIX7_9BRAS|nr:unnamed protein product [Arabis nemorensis]
MLHSLLSIKTCQVCMRSFPNGKALGGHMRSHARKFSLPKATSSATASTIPTLQASNKLGATFTPGETVLLRSVHTNEVGDGPKPDLKNEEGGQQVTGKRKFLFDLNEVYTEEPQSSLTVEEESALLLVEMSKGKRPANFQSPTLIDPPLALGGHRTSHKKRLKIGEKNDEAVVPRQYPCVICEKVFGSGQALGGHKKVHLAYLEPCR